ncbi:hypothetical protein KCP73_07810 [Salmonella enterica subsp. enterica]|nr:hypothetical protein KCP73_07810 [Salmonella enterica subsp. enterica]
MARSAATLLDCWHFWHLVVGYICDKVGKRKCSCLILSLSALSPWRHHACFTELPVMRLIGIVIGAITPIATSMMQFSNTRQRAGSHRLYRRDGTSHNSPTGWATGCSATWKRGWRWPLAAPLSRA